MPCTKTNRNAYFFEIEAEQDRTLNFEVILLPVPSFCSDRQFVTSYQGVSKSNLGGTSKRKIETNPTFNKGFGLLK